MAVPRTMGIFREGRNGNVKFTRRGRVDAAEEGFGSMKQAPGEDLDLILLPKTNRK